MTGCSGNGGPGHERAEEEAGFSCAASVDSIVAARTRASARCAIVALVGVLLKSPTSTTRSSGSAVSRITLSWMVFWLRVVVLFVFW